MRNPSKYIRAGIITTLAPLTVPVWNKRIPKNASTPTKYILIINQDTQQYERSKSCYEYSCTFTLDLCNITTLGNDATVQVDDLEEAVRTAMDSLRVPNFVVKDMSYSSFDLDMDTGTNTINRRLITYTIWLNYVV